MEAERINLTVSGPVARVVAELADLMGLSKSAAVASYLAWQLPSLRAHVERLRASGGPGGPIEGGSDPSGVRAGSAASAPSTAVRDSDEGAGMNRAQKRQLRKDERKAGLR